MRKFISMVLIMILIAIFLIGCQPEIDRESLTLAGVWKEKDTGNILVLNEDGTYTGNLEELRYGTYVDEDPEEGNPIITFH